MLLCMTIASALFAAVPALLFWRNLTAYAPRPSFMGEQATPPVSVLIPARNEENAIGDAVAAVLQSRGVEFEVIVLDDNSEDQTAAIVERLADSDHRVRLVTAPALPAGWCGKQHACWTLGQRARHPFLVFIDADVRLESSALARMAAFLTASKTHLASGIPRQETVTLLEKLLIPLIHFILLSYLPIRWMRKSHHPSFAAGCGQLFIADARAYLRCGGHAAVRDTLHDGLKLPRAFRADGWKTDLFDATDLASCRMYHGACETWFGLAKNASEALASPGLILPVTMLLLVGQVLPGLLLLMGLCSWPRLWPLWQLWLAAAATTAAFAPRLAAVGRFRQSSLGALLHPVGILLLVAIQWFAFVRNALGRSPTWKGRPCPKHETSSTSTCPRDLEPTFW
jgi:hypothetical protein